MGKAQVIPFGPQHPVLPEPLHLDLVVQDETVVDVLPQIGFVHRGLEKLVETRDIHQYIYVAERICGICAFGHSYGYAQTIESMMNVEVPERAEFLRVIMHELSRIHSHLLWMGLAADAFGYEALFMHCWRLRERILDIFEAVAGGRVILSYTLLGGVAKDIEAPTLAAIKDTLNSLKKEYAEICNAFLKDSSVKNRTVGVGFIDEEHAREYGMVGPFARASNFNNDVRCLGIGAYGNLSSFEPILDTQGDCYARIKVRSNEVLQSIDFVNELIDKIPGTIFLVNRYRTSRTAFFADTAIDAVLWAKNNLSSQRSGMLGLLKRIPNRFRFSKKRPKGHFTKLETTHRSYLSVQLMQGSIVRTIMLTSDISHPFRAMVMPAMF